MTIPAEEGYYNQFDAAKRYVEVRARAGYPPQSQEFNELQAIVRNIHQGLASTLFKEGSIVKAEAGTFSQSADGSSLEMKTVQFYADGLIHEVPAATLTLPQTGLAYVGVRLTEVLVTAEQDLALLDPAVEELNYGQPGANRRKVTAAWELRTVDTPLAGYFNVFTFLNRQQQVAVAVGQIDPVMQTLARRTYDESGNYVVNGYDLSVEADLDDASSTFRLKVGNRNDANRVGSTAYVQGNQVIKLVPVYLDVDKARETSEAVDTYHRYTVTTGYSPTNHRFLLFKQPVSAISEVYAFFDKVVTVSGHNLNGFDEIPLGQGESLAQVMQVFTAGDTSEGSIRNPEKVYLDATSNIGLGAYYLQGTRLYWNPVPGSDADAWTSTATYQTGTVVKYLAREGVDRYWRARQFVSAGKPPVKDLAGTIEADFWQEVYLDEPVANETYHVYLRYQRALQPAEFALYTDAAGQSYLDLSYFINPAVQKPFVTNLADGSQPGSDLRIEYQYYLSRVDVVYLDGAGELKVAKGQSAERPVAPPVLPDVLALGSLMIGAGQGHAGTVITAYNVKRLTMIELRELIERLNRAEYNVAVNDLNNQALQRAGGGAGLRGIVTESFIYTTDNLAKRELRFDPSLSSPLSLDLLAGQYSLPLAVHTYDTPSKPYRLTLTQSAEARAKSGGERLLTLTRASVDTGFTKLLQDTATGAIQVNQFDEFVSLPSLELKFSKDGAMLKAPTLTTLDSQSFKNLIHNYEFDWKTYTEKRDVYRQALNNTGTAKTGIPLVMAPTYNEVTGSGFPAFTFLELRVDGRRPYMTRPEAAATGFICKPDGTRLTDEVAQNILLETTGASISAYPSSYLIQTDAAGQFKVGFYIPEGISSGTVAVEVQAVFTGVRIAAQASYTAVGMTTVVDNTAELAQLVRLIEAPTNQVKPKFIPDSQKPVRYYRITRSGGTVTRTLLTDANVSLTGTDRAEIEVDVHYLVNDPTAGVPHEVGLEVRHANAEVNDNMPTSLQFYGRDGSVTRTPTNGSTANPFSVAWNPADGVITIKDGGLKTINKAFDLNVFLTNRDSNESVQAAFKVNTQSANTQRATVVMGDLKIVSTAPAAVQVPFQAENYSTVTVQTSDGRTATVTQAA